MNLVSLITSVENAFDGTARAGTSLRQFQLTDRYGMSREITVDEWAAAGNRRVDATWQEISDEEIEECDCLLAHMGPEEFLYYLPAYPVRVEEPSQVNVGNRRARNDLIFAFTID
jgi:hypothetical protein